MGIGDWGLGIGDWGLGPIPNPQAFQINIYYILFIIYNIKPNKYKIKYFFK